jgi:hypothetical protein
MLRDKHGNDGAAHKHSGGQKRPAREASYSTDAMTASAAAAQSGAEANQKTGNNREQGCGLNGNLKLATANKDYA